MRRLLCILMMACGDEKGPDSDMAAEDTDPKPADDTSTLGDDTATDSGEPLPPPGCRHETSTALGEKTCIQTAACTWEGAQQGSYSGFSVAAGLDFDGDGREDIALGAPLYDVQTMTSGLWADAGLVQLISAAQIGEPEMGILGHLGGRDDGDLLGTAVALVPDINGDGLAEIIAGARGSGASGESYAGEVQLLLGSATGWEEDTDSGTIIPTSRFWGERAYSRVGKVVAGGQDVDGDGLGEVWISGELNQVGTSSSYEYNAEGRIYRIAGHTEDWEEVTSLADADAAIDGVDSMGGAGLALAADADLDGDGYGDLVVGAPYATSNKGTVYLVPGGPEAMRGSSSLEDAPVQLIGEAAGDTFGWTVAVGDVTGDGQPDLIVGAPLADSSTPDAGLVTIYEGGPSMLTDGPTIRTQIAGEFDDHQLGTGLMAGRDLTGDGQADLVMGAVNAWQGLTTKGGRLYILAGTPALPEMSSARFVDHQVYGAEVKEYLGRAMGQADLDADGKTDLLVGSGYANGEEGVDAGRLYLFWGE